MTLNFQISEVEPRYYADGEDAHAMKWICRRWWWAEEAKAAEEGRVCGAGLQGEPGDPGQHTSWFIEVACQEKNPATDGSGRTARNPVNPSKVLDAQDSSEDSDSTS